MKNLLILPQDQSIFTLQKLVVPEKLSNILLTHFGKCVLVKRTATHYTINIVYPRLNLNSSFCMMDDSVIYSEQLVNSFPVYSESLPRHEISLDQIKVLDEIEETSEVLLSVVFRDVFQLCEWKSKLSKFKRILENMLGLFVFSRNSTLVLRSLNFPAEIHCIVIHSTGHESRVPCRLSPTGTVVIHKLISLTSYLQLIQGTAGTEIGGLQNQSDLLMKMIEAQRSYRQKWNSEANIRLPKQILLVGASGSGKTALVHSIAAKTQSLTMIINGSEVMNSSPGESEKFLRNKFKEAKLLLDENENGVCILLIKQVECLARKRHSETGASTLRCMSQFLNLLDSANSMSGLFVIATTDKASDLDPAIRRSGRLETEVYIEVPSEKDRAAILSVYLKQLNLENVESVCNKIAVITPGYLGADLVLIVKTFQLRLSSIKYSSSLLNEAQAMELLTDIVSQHQPSSLKSGIGMVLTEPLLMSQLGGLDKIKQTLKVYLEWPLLYPEKFEKLDVPPPKGILLYGPPGCAKTSLARALASVTNMTFFSVSAAELYSPFVGATERNIVELFRRARIGAPSIVFIDEIDALVGKRGDSKQDVHERALSTFLTEMDGVGVNVDALPLKSIGDNVRNRGVVVVAATNRPDKLDAAILRPGRLNKLIYVPPPTESERLSILKAVTEKVPLDADADLQLIATITELFSGADIVNLIREAGLCALTDDGMSVSEVKQKHFLKALGSVRPSLSVDQVLFTSSISLPQTPVLHHVGVRLRSTLSTLNRSSFPQPGFPPDANPLYWISAKSDGNQCYVSPR